MEVTHEGTSQVKESKINLLVHKYEIFKMKKYESISDIFSKFTNIVNALNAFGKTYANYDLVCKVLRSLPKEWEAKVTAIQEAKDLTKLSLEKLMGSLMIYELNIARKKEKEEPKKIKTIAFKSTTQYEESDESDEEENEEESEDDENLAFLTRKFKKFLKERDMKKKENEEKKCH